ncbi:MAG: site-specific integrase [Mesorhizobium sp.]|uniref:tyrosine-type recombinase/integrase n=1 Tax=Mesorhizobium sp. TaxID=1871066 RepID=UPI000FE79E53|nr:site-specific integrase [Mesorhizobium sp.]RWB08835.1 MAG: site-specific integrase [Mesorhizobium sp.]RWB13514.1 MAG: site-specific integrase [Mesorhizobium sp.]
MAELYKRPESPYLQAYITVAGVKARISTKEKTRKLAQIKADLVEKQENAKAEAARMEAEAQAGLRFVDACDRFFLVKTDLQPKTVVNYNSNVSNIYRVLGDFALRSLTVIDIKSYVATRIKTVGSVAIRRDLGFLSSLYNTAVDWEEEPLVNIVSQYDQSVLPEAKERKRWLRGPEVQRLLDACVETYQKLFIYLAVDTGMRSGELKKLKWDDIDFKRREIVIGNQEWNRTKNGEIKIIYLSVRSCNALLHTKKKSNSQWVFPSPKVTDEDAHITTTKTWWARVTRVAKLEGVRFHDLRHTFASWLNQTETGEIPSMNLLGHKTSSMVKRYAHTSPTQLRDAIRRLEGYTELDTGPSGFQKTLPRGVRKSKKKQ